MFNSFTDEQEEQGEEGERREEAAGAPRGVHDQERGRPPRGRLPVAQVRPESRQEQPIPEVRVYMLIPFLLYLIIRCSVLATSPSRIHESARVLTTRISCGD